MSEVVRANVLYANPFPGHFFCAAFPVLRVLLHLITVKDGVKRRIVAVVHILYRTRPAMLYDHYRICIDKVDILQRFYDKAGKPSAAQLLQKLPEFPHLRVAQAYAECGQYNNLLSEQIGFHDLYLHLLKYRTPRHRLFHVYLQSKLFKQLCGLFPVVPSFDPVSLHLRPYKEHIFLHGHRIDEPALS